MVSVAKHMPKFHYDPAIGSFKAWLLNMTRWRMRDQFRKRDPCRKHDSSSDETATGTRTVDRMADPMSHDLDGLWEAEWEKNLLDAAMAKVKRRIDPQKFQIFDLYANKEWSPAKVAKAFGVTVGQVYLAKNRVTELLREEVKRLEKKMT
jgi:RNA polymerase sigma factor (sigma-70 family)